MTTRLDVLRAIAQFSKPHAGMIGACVRRADLAAELDLDPLCVSGYAHELCKAGLVEAAPKRGRGPQRGWYRLTDAGRAYLVDPEASAPPTRRSAGERFERVWRAVRAQKRGDIASLLAVVHDATAALPDDMAAEKVRGYLRALEAAGVVRRIAVGTVNARWLLLDDLGPLAPVRQTASGRLWDPNARRYLPEVGR